MSHQRFGEIRSLLHQHQPDEALWSRLTQLLWGWRGHLPEEVMASYCDGVLMGWPDELRVLPRAWLRALLRGQDTALSLICRNMPLANKQITLDKFRMLCASRHLKHITLMDLSENRFANHINDLDWIEPFSTAPFLSSIERLHLRSSWLNDEALLRLGALHMPALRHLDLSSNMKLRSLPQFLELFSGSASLDVLELGWNLTSVTSSMRFDYYREGPHLYEDYLRPEHLVSAMRHLPALRELNLYRSSCEPDFLVDHGELFSGLDTLHLSVDYANKAWQEAIRTSEALRGLRALHISRIANEDVDATLDALIEMKQHEGCKLKLLGLPFEGINHLRVHDAKRALLEGVELAQVD